MKIKALRDIGGSVTAHSGQEIDVTEAQALDLIQQGVATPVNASEYQSLKAMSTEDLAKMRELNAYQSDQFIKAVSEAQQKIANAESDAQEQRKADIRQMAQQSAEQHSQALAQAKQSQAQAEQQMAQAKAQAQQTMNQAQMQAESSQAQAMGQMHQQAMSHSQQAQSNAQSQATSQSHAVSDSVTQSQATGKATAKNQEKQ